jgi:hypothetical protein
MNDYMFSLELGKFDTDYTNSKDPAKFHKDEIKRYKELVIDAQDRMIDHKVAIDMRNQWIKQLKAKGRAKEDPIFEKAYILYYMDQQKKLHIEIQKRKNEIQFYKRMLYQIENAYEPRPVLVLPEPSLN